MECILPFGMLCLSAWRMMFVKMVLAASIPCPQTVETFPCGPWSIITFCQLFVKGYDVYVRFIAQSLPPFDASNNFSLEGCRLYT